MKNVSVTENDDRGRVCVRVRVSEVKDEDLNTTFEMACMW